MAYKKPQDPLTNNGFGIYPLTTADQVILSDGSRLEKNGVVSVDVATAADSSKLGGVAASDYALKTDTAPNSSKLDGKTFAEIMLALYPVGAVYISTNSTSPASLFGGTWEQLKDRFLLGAGDSYTAGNTSGSATHQHSYGFQYGAYYGSLGLENSNANTAGLLTYDSNNNIALTGHSTSSQGGKEARINGAATTSGKVVTMTHYRMVANTSNTSNMPPYLAVYMWKRIPDETV